MLNPEQIKALRTSAGLSPELPTVASTPDDSVKKRLAEFDTAVGARKKPEIVPETIQDAFKNTAETYKNAPTDFIKEAGRNDESTSKNPVIRVGENALGATSSAIGSIFAPFTGAVKAFSDQLSNDKHVQDLTQHPAIGKILDFFGGAGDKLAEFEKAHPEAARNLNNALTVGLTAVGGEQLDKPIGSFSDIKNGITDTAKEVSQNIKEVGGKIKSPKEMIGNYAEGSLKNEWTKPTEIARPTYKKATEIFNNSAEKGHDITDTLVKNKISLSDNVEEGNYNTKETADNLREDAGKMSRDVLRPSLVEADMGAPKTPVQEVIDDSIKNINANKKLTQETRDALIEKLQLTQTSLEKQFPDGMGLADMHDEKIVRDLNSKYSPVGDIATNNEAVKNKALADSMRKKIELKAPEGLPIKEFNAELSKQYQTADYLEALHGKRVPVSIASKIAKTAAKVAGASAGSGLGGGIMGGVGGYHIGGMIEGMLENIPNPFKASFLKNIKVTNPQAFEAIQKYLGEQEVARLERLALPEPSFTALGPKTPNKSGIEIVDAKKNPVSVNPKTKKFQTSYSSTSKK